MSRDGVGRLTEEADPDQIFRRDRQRDRVADRLVKAVVGAVAEEHRLPLVGALVEVVSQLVVDGGEVFGGRLDAHLDAQVVQVVDVPGVGVAHDLAILRTHEQRSLEERVRQRREAQRRVEAFAGPDHLERRHVALFQDVGQRVAGISVGRRDQRIDVRPVLRPDVAEQMRRNRAAGRNEVAVFLAQLQPHVRVQLQVERPHLVPESIELVGERVGRHVVPAAPHRAGIGEAQLLRALVRQFNEALVVLAHRRRNRVPAFPGGADRGFVARRRDDPRNLVDVPTGVRLARVRAPLALAVGGLEPRHDLRELVGFLRIRRRGQHQRDLQQVQLTALRRGQLHLVVLRRLLGKASARVVRRLAGARGNRFGVVGDEVLLHPAGLALVDAKLQRRLVGGGEKGRSRRWRRRRR